MDVTPVQDGRTDLWARLRSIDPRTQDGPACQHCSDLALFQFRVEYPIITFSGEHVRDEVHDSFACGQHVGSIASAAALEMLSGPSGAT